MTARATVVLCAGFALLAISSGHASPWEDMILRADSLLAVGEYAPAESLYQQSLSAAEAEFGADHPNTAVSLHRLGRVYTDMGDFDRAESLIVTSLAIRLESLGPDDPEVASTRFALATVYLYTGRLERAEEELLTALSVMTGLLGADHPDVALYLNGLGSVYLQAGRYEDSEDMLTRALAIREAAFGQGHPDVMKTLVNLGVLYGSLGRYADAEPLLTTALTIAESLVGTEHPLVASVLMNLANVYTWLGDYTRARLAYARSLGIMEMFLGPDHPDVAGVLGNLAAVAGQQGDLEEARELHQAALEIRERVLGPDHPEVALSLANLGATYISLGEYDMARDALERALAIDSESLGADHPAVAADLENMGQIALYEGDYEEADSLYRRSLSIKRAATGSRSHEVARTLGYLGDLRIRQLRLDEAETLFLESLAITREVFAEEHYLVAENLERLSEVSRHKNEALDAVNLAEQGLRIRHRALVENSAVLSESDALTYSGLLKTSFHNYLSCYCSLDEMDEANVPSPADMVFSCKGEVSDGLFERSRSIVEEADSATASMAETLRFARFQLAQMFVEGSGADPEAYYLQFTQMEGEIADLESDLALQSVAYRTRRQRDNVTAQSVISALPEGSYLVEYIRYDHSDPVAETSEARYLAVALSDDGDPVVLPLGPAAAVESLVDEYRQHMLRVSRGTGPPTPFDLAEYRGIGLALWETVWAPLEEHIAGHDMVVIAPDGALNMVSFAGLVRDDGDYLNDHLTIHYLSSARDLLRLAERAESGHGLLAFGDPDYDAAPYTEMSDAPEEMGEREWTAAGMTRGIRSGCEEFGHMRVPALPGTRKEVKLIEDSWNRSSRGPATVYTGADASEGRLKAEAHGHSVIHLATHGYYLSDRCGAIDRPARFDGQGSFIGENPLLLSGLFLAGANMRVEEDLGFRGEDGILTAYEVTSLDLRGTDLVVLSACETGLGKVREGEGVYGLRRAFQMAGARTVVSALWPVPDEATARMAGLLYEEEGSSIAESIRRAQAHAIDNLRSRGEPDHPFLWAGFVAVGAWD